MKPSSVWESYDLISWECHFFSINVSENIISHQYSIWSLVECSRNTVLVFLEHSTNDHIVEELHNRDIPGYVDIQLEMTSMKLGKTFIDYQCDNSGMFFPISNRISYAIFQNLDQRFRNMLTNLDFFRGISKRDSVKNQIFNLFLC